MIDWFEVIDDTVWTLVTGFLLVFGAITMGWWAMFFVGMFATSMAVNRIETYRVKVEEPDPDGPYDDPMRSPGFSDDQPSPHMTRCESKNPKGDQCNRYSGHDGNHESTRGQSPMIVPPITWE